MRGRTAGETGFTVVELIITLLFAVMVLIGVYRVTSAIVSLTMARSQAVVAGNIAYSNLRQYVNGRPPTWYECDEENNLEPVVLKHSTAAIDRLPEPIVEHISATAPYGCGGLASGMPIRVESYVIYGTEARKVTHVGYASY